MFPVLEMESQINGHLLKISMYNMTNCYREYYKLSNDIYPAIIRKVFLSEFWFYYIFNWKYLYSTQECETTYVLDSGSGET